MIKTISALSKYKNEATKTKDTDKLFIKSIILPDVYESDDSTINLLEIFLVGAYLIFLQNLITFM